MKANLYREKDLMQSNTDIIVIFKYKYSLDVLSFALTYRNIEVIITSFRIGRRLNMTFSGCAAGRSRYALIKFRRV